MADSLDPPPTEEPADDDCGLSRAHAYLIVAVVLHLPVLLGFTMLQPGAWLLHAFEEQEIPDEVRLETYAATTIVLLALAYVMFRIAQFCEIPPITGRIVLGLTILVFAVRAS